MNNTNNPNEMNMKKMAPIVLVIIAAIFLIAFGSRMFVNIEAGHLGVVFNTLGGGIDVNQQPMGEGLNIIAPWNKVYEYSVRQREKAENMKVLSSNGLEIDVDVSAWFYPQRDKVAYLHKYLGKDYETQVVMPALRSAARSVIGRYTPEEIYSTKRDVIQVEIYEETKKILDKKYINLDKVLIRSIILPPNIKNAIESKLKQEQLSLEYKYKLESARKEAERQRIEAEGEAAANKIINSSLSDNLLKMRGIEATIKLANSPNSKVIVVGSGKDGLPLILNNN